ncbi:hypothetical protein QJQ45_021608 [Haematococcus lacustris]|nr:hypothetical protein QJQ45_021608 [Haematococcus lacustris]
MSNQYANVQPGQPGVSGLSSEPAHFDLYLCAELSSHQVKVEVKEGAGSTEEVDFSKIGNEEALKILQASLLMGSSVMLPATVHGLSADEAAKRLIEYGPNKLPESTRNPFLVFLGYLWNPLSWAMEVAAIISIALLDYADFALIVALLIVNASISYVEEANADKAIKALAAALAPKAKALRGGEVINIEAKDLVPGDVIIIRLGDIVPADVKILPEEGGGGGEEVPMQIDQAALTGESLPAKKFTGDVAFSGSAIKQGERHAVVYATGVNTFFGRAAALISGTHNVANLQVIMTKIGGICLVTIGVWVVIELCVQFGHYRHACLSGEEGCPTLTNMLVIIVGGIPIAMPTVLSVTLALGASKLAKEGAIVARMSAVEEMAGMDVLCSDKTGTLTLNKLSVEPQSIMLTGSVSADEIMKLAALSANTITEEPIDMVLWESYPSRSELKSRYKTVKFVPFNPTDKITIATVLDLQTNKIIRLLKGSPQVVLRKAYNKDQLNDPVNNKMIEFANRGFRSLGLAMADGDGVGEINTKWEMICLLPMFDPPRHDTKETIERCMDQGITVKMITGDHLLIGKETARMLGMGVEVGKGMAAGQQLHPTPNRGSLLIPSPRCSQMYPSEVLIKARNGDKESMHGYSSVSEMCEKCNGFAEVFPEHKFEIVKILQDADHVCGMTGDGVNDAPALKKADVGIAVHGATDAARGAADIVLTEPGLSTIVTAVIGARKIFQRMTTYSKYTVAMTFRICFTFGLLTVIYDWYFPTILIVIMAVFNDGAMIALAKDRVIPSRLPNSWNLNNIFLMGIVYGLFLTLSSWALYQTAVKTTFFEDKCGLFSLNDQPTRVDAWCAAKIERELPASSNFGLTPYTSICALPSYRNQWMPDGSCEGYDPVTMNRLTFGQLPGELSGPPSILDQCNVEQIYIRGAMTRTLLYVQISVSGQALVFVVRHQGWSLIQRAGSLTYIAFVLAQLGSTLIGIFGFAGYVPPRERFQDCMFCGLSTGYKTPFFPSMEVPISGTESRYTASVIGCTGYVIVAWIWSAIWYMPLDLVKWMMCWILNEDGFRDQPAWKKQKKHRPDAPHKNNQENEIMGPPGFAPANLSNPMGRTSMSKPVAHVLDRASAAVVTIQRNSQGVAQDAIQKIPPLCKAHRDRAKVMRRECLVLDEGLVKECYKQDEDADSFKSTVQGSRAQHSMYFPADTEGELMWSMTACACGARMSNPPQPCGAQCRGSMPLEPMHMLLDKEAARQAALNAECIRLMLLDTPGMPPFDTLNKDLLKAWCKHNNIRGVSSKSKNELRDMCLLKLREKVEATRHM